MEIVTETPQVEEEEEEEPVSSSSSSSSRRNNEHSSNGNSSSNSNDLTILELSPFFSNLLEVIWTESSLILQTLSNIITNPLFDQPALRRVSISMLCCHHFNLFLQSWIINITMVDISDTLSNTWLLGIPLIASTIIALLVALPYIWRPYQEAVVITALVALFCLEALLPLLIFIGTYLLLTGQLEIYSGVALLALVWFLITAATHWISCTIFQQMGHG